MYLIPKERASAAIVDTRKSQAPSSKEELSAFNRDHLCFAGFWVVIWYLSLFTGIELKQPLLA